MKEIIFTNTYNVDIDQPKPASQFIPKWYKNLESYIGGNKKPDGDGKAQVTIKKCIPVFDAITAGYIICLYLLFCLRLLSSMYFIISSIDRILL